MYILVSGACWKQGITIVIAHTYYSYYYYYYYYSGQSLARNSPRTVCHRPMNEVSNRPAHWGEVCYDFYRGSGVRCSPQGRKSGPKSSIDLTLRRTLSTHSSERGFRRNVWFATFEEADRPCKNIPHNGVKVAPLGGRSVPKLPHWLTMGKECPVKHTCFSYYGKLHRDFVMNVALDHSVIETRGWAHFTQTTNQSLRIIVKLSSHALATI